MHKVYLSIHSDADWDHLLGALSTAGFRTELVLREISVVTGTASGEALRGLSRIPGVAGIEVRREQME